MGIGRNHSAEKKSVALIFILFLNLFLMSFNIVLKNEKSLIANIVTTIFSPIQIGVQKTIDFFSFEINRYVFLKNMSRRYMELKKEHLEMKYENYLLRTKQKQLEFERKVYDQNPTFTGAELVFVDSNIPFDSLMINKGSLNGIKKNMVVLNEYGELVGRVIDPVTMLSAKVRLITSRLGGVGAYIKKNQLEGFLTGKNQKRCQFKYLMENAPVDVGDQVVTSGTDQIFPAYLPIGKVVKIRREYLTQEIEIEPFFLKRSIKHLVIMTDTKEKSDQ